MAQSLTEAPIELTRSARDVSVTERGSFRTCRRRWKIETIDNLTPKQPQWALEFGTGIHSALEMYYKIVALDRKPPDPLGEVVKVFRGWHDQVAASQQKELGGLWTDAAANDLWEMFLLGKTMLENYAEYSSDQAEVDPWEIIAIEGKDPRTDTIVTPEMLGMSRDDIPYDEDVWPFIREGRILCPIVDPNTGEWIDGHPYLSGRLDLIVRRPKKRNDLFVADHKTTASSPSDRGLDFDDQTTGYSYLVWRLTGTIPRGTIFNYLVKQIPKEPRRVQRNKGNPTGLSTAKDQLCLASDYREALIEDGLLVKGKVTSDAHADCYQALLTKGWDPYFKRFEPTRNLNEVLSFEERLFHEYADMRDVFDHQEKAYPNLSTWWCPSCSVAPICQAMEDGSDVLGIIESRFMQAPDRKAER